MGREETAIDRVGRVVADGQMNMVAGRSMVQVRPSDYCTAMMIPLPRNEDLALKRIKRECEADPEQMIYSWEVANRAQGANATSLVEGLTIKAAMMLAREWGNCAATAKLVEESAGHYLFEGVYVDLETGFNCVRPYRMAKGNFSGRGKMQQERAEDMVFEIGVSKATRNAVINGIPSRVYAEAMKAIKAALGAKYLSKNAADGVARMLDSFKPMGITLMQLEKRVGKPSTKWGKEDFGALRVIYDSIMGGETTVQQQFSVPKPETAPAPAPEAAIPPAAEPDEDGVVPDPADADPGEPPPEQTDADPGEPPPEQAPPPAEPEQAPATSERPKGRPGKLFK